MPVLQAWALSDFTGIINTNRSSTTPGYASNQSVTLSSTAQLVDVDIVDDDDTLLQDAYIEDGDLSTLGAPLTLPDGSTFTVGQNIEAEIALVTTDVPPITFYIGRIGTGTSNSGQNQVVFTDAPLVPGQTYTFIDGGGFDGPTVPFSTICFAAGTMIATDQGERPVEMLSVGDKVFTRGAGYQPLIWCGKRKVTPGQLAANPTLAPIRFEKGSLGNDEPASRLQLSAQHRVLHRSAMADLHFGSSEVLVAAKAFCNGNSIRRHMPPRGITYVHIMCKAHQIVRANGMWCETLLPGKMSHRSMTEAQRCEIEALFPDLYCEGAQGLGSARPVLSPREFASLGVA